MRQRHHSIEDETWWRQDWWTGKEVNRNIQTEYRERRKNGSYIRKHEWCETEQKYATYVKSHSQEKTKEIRIII